MYKVAIKLWVDGTMCSYLLAALCGGLLAARQYNKLQFCQLWMLCNLQWLTHLDMVIFLCLIVSQSSASFNKFCILFLDLNCL